MNVFLAFFNILSFSRPGIWRSVQKLLYWISMLMVPIVGVFLIMLRKREIKTFNFLVTLLLFRTSWNFEVIVGRWSYLIRVNNFFINIRKCILLHRSILLLFHLQLHPSRNRRQRVFPNSQVSEWWWMWHLFDPALNSSSSSLLSLVNHLLLLILLQWLPLVFKSLHHLMLFKVQSSLFIGNNIFIIFFKSAQQGRRVRDHYALAQELGLLF